MATEAQQADLPQETLDYFKDDDLRARVFIDKYALRRPGSNDSPGELLERTPPQMWRRIAREIASVEKTPAKRKYWESKFYWLLDNFRFVPGGRIMHGAGNLKGRVTLLNCYVLPFRDPGGAGSDSLAAIYQRVNYEMARTYSSGGGVGIDISSLRPRRSIVHNASSTSSGAVSFMETYSRTTGTIGQDGRRGALMITIADWHPDVLAFASIKTQPNDEIARTLESFKHLFDAENYAKIERVLVSLQVRYANISIRVSDAFMRAVETDGLWNLEFPDYEKAGMDVYHAKWTGDLAAWKAKDLPVRLHATIRARELWGLLIKGARDYAEPGCLFWDTTLRYSTSEYNGMGVVTTNPCAEIPLEPYGCCCLGNINLSEFVRYPFEEAQAKVGWKSLEKALRLATRFLDNVLTYNADKHPLPEQREASLRSRRIGVGFTGLGDMLIKLRMKYDTDEAIQFVDAMFERIKNVVYDESANLAAEKGRFPAYNARKHWTQNGKPHPFLSGLWPKVQAKARKNGLRNVALLTVPPVGSGAALAGVTSGVEPIFALRYTRRSESLSQSKFKVNHPLALAYIQRFRIEREEDLPSFFVTAHQISAEKRVAMQAAIQKHIDHSLSSTINLPRDTKPEEVERIYFLAWKAGCKGITVYREGSREGILITEGAAGQDGAGGVDNDPLIPRPEVLPGKSFRLVTPAGSAFIGINYDGDDDPMEIFTQVGKQGNDVAALAEAVSRLASIILRLRSQVSRKRRLKLIAEQLDGIGGRTSVGFGPKRIKSVPDGMAKAIRMFTGENGGGNGHEGSSSAAPEPTNPKLDKEAHYDLCPHCRDFGLVSENGCFHCILCGYDEC